MSRKLEKTLGLNPLPMIIVEDEDPEDIISQDQKIEEDVDDARSNLHDAVSIAQQAIQDMLNIAQQSQHPKAYETLNGLLKTYSDISMNMADLHIKKQRLDQKKPGDSDDHQTITNNNVFVGSTAELQQMIEDMKNKR
jgi:hypothetical protein